MTSNLQFLEIFHTDLDAVEFRRQEVVLLLDVVLLHPDFSGRLGYRYPIYAPLPADVVCSERSVEVGKPADDPEDALLRRETCTLMVHHTPCRIGRWIS